MIFKNILVAGYCLPGISISIYNRDTLLLSSLPSIVLYRIEVDRIAFCVSMFSWHLRILTGDCIWFAFRLFSKYARFASSIVDGQTFIFSAARLPSPLSFSFLPQSLSLSLSKRASFSLLPPSFSLLPFFLYPFPSYFALPFFPSASVSLLNYFLRQSIHMSSS